MLLLLFLSSLFQRALEAALNRDASASNSVLAQNYGQDQAAGLRQKLVSLKSAFAMMQVTDEQMHMQAQYLLDSLAKLGEKVCCDFV